MADAGFEDFFGGVGSVPVGGMVMVPYKLTEDGLDDTNVDVFASYPENWLYPQGQILLSATYPALKALLNTDRIYEVLGVQAVFINSGLSSATVDIAGAMQSRFAYAAAGVSGQGMKLVLHDITGATGQISATDDSGQSGTAKQRNFPKHGNTWNIDTSDVSIISTQWRNGLSFASNATVEPVVYPTFGSVTVSTGSIAVAAVKHAIGMYFIGSDIYAHMKYQATLAVSYARAVYKSINDGTSWTLVAYSDTSATSISTVHNTWHDSDVGSSSLLVVSRGEMQTTFAVTGGTGSGAKVNVEGIDSLGQCSRVKRHPTASNGSSGTGYTIGDVLTITNGAAGTATLRVDSLSFGGVANMTVTASTTDWTGDTALVEVTAENTFIERLVLEDDNDAVLISEMTLYTGKSNIVIKKLGATYFLGTPGNLYYSTDKVTWTKAVLPPNTLPYSIEALEDGAFTVDHSDQQKTAGYYTLDVTDWTTAKTRKHSSSSFFDEQRGFVSEGSLSRAISSNNGNALYLPDYQLAFDPSVEFQVPNLIDPGEQGMGLGIYPLMRLK